MRIWPNKQPPLLLIFWKISDLLDFLFNPKFMRSEASNCFQVTKGYLWFCQASSQLTCKCSKYNFCQGFPKYTFFTEYLQWLLLNLIIFAKASVIDVLRIPHSFLVRLIADLSDWILPGLSAVFLSITSVISCCYFSLEFLSPCSRSVEYYFNPITLCYLYDVLDK